MRQPVFKGGFTVAEPVKQAEQQYLDHVMEQLQVAKQAAEKKIQTAKRDIKTGVESRLLRLLLLLTVNLQIAKVREAQISSAV